ncbi:MAG: type II/IV secretion system protein [Candidatus Omnitrophica bacterium]|nr:type II/IV secretion system protein [Candidatus Omnitrophota bacterium]
MSEFPEIKLAREEINAQVVRMIPEEIARKYKVISVKLDDSTLFVAMADPANLPLRDELKLLTGCNISPLRASEREITKAIGRYYKAEEISKQALIDIRLAELKKAKKKKPMVSMDEPISEVGQVPVVKLVNDIVSGGINSAASDIHLEPQEPEMVVRYRIDGMLHDIMTIPKHIESAVISRIKVLANMNIAERRRPQDGHIVLNRNAREYDMRVSTMLTVAGEKTVMRIFDKTAMLIGLEELGFTSEDETRFEKLIKRPYGIVLITGPTGCGKTTTLYAILKQLNATERNIITIENPVEYKINRINQVQVDEGAKITFATGLKTILRQDPDIIMVGEIRDKETAEIAMQAALTGHLVLSTLHTNDAASAITRLVDMGVEPFLVSATVIGAAAQRLCRTICPECKGKKCSACYETGYKGRIGVFELMAVSENIQNLILSKASVLQIRKQAEKEGMKTLAENGADKVAEGVTTKEEIKRIVY